MLKISNLHKSFDSNEILKGLNIDIKEGSIFGLVGINGSGKSTLLRTISGVYEPNEGQVTLDGVDTFRNPKIRKDIIFVSDDVYFPAKSTIKSLKTFYESFYDLDEQRYQKYLKIINLDEEAPISRFSKGMKRKVSLLFALAISPKLLLLDECFDGLDPVARLTFKKAIIDLIEDRNTIIIISSHNLKELEDICDSFGILDDGQVNTYGDLLESKENIVKFQIAYSEDVDYDYSKMFNVLSYRKEGRIVNLVVKGNIDEAREKINGTNPLLVDELPVNFEELFIYEVESRGMING